MVISIVEQLPFLLMTFTGFHTQLSVQWVQNKKSGSGFFPSCWMFPSADSRKMKENQRTTRRRAASKGSSGDNPQLCSALNTCHLDFRHKRQCHDGVALPCYCFHILISRFSTRPKKKKVGKENRRNLSERGRRGTRSRNGPT